MGALELWIAIGQTFLILVSNCFVLQNALCEVNMYMKMKNNSKSQRVGMNKNETKVKNQKQRRIWEAWMKQ
jgi:hypothetical protein